MSAECGRNHPGPCAWVGKGGPLEPLCLQPERPEPPVTADHTPERRELAEEREAEALADSIAGCFSNVSDLPEWMQVQALGRYMRPLVLLAARAVLASDWHAAHLADVEARLAAVEALVRELHISGDLTPAGTDALLRALHPAPRRGGPR